MPQVQDTHLINKKLRLYIYSFLSLNEAFRVFSKLSTQERINVQLLKNLNSNSQNNRKFYISFNERACLMIDMKYLQNFSNHYVLQQNPHQNLNKTQYFNFFIETFPKERMADTEFSFSIKENKQSHHFDSIQTLENYHNQKLKKYQLKLNGIIFFSPITVQEYLLDTQQIHIHNSILAYSLIKRFKEYEDASQTNNQNLQALRNEIFNSNQVHDLQCKKFVFKDSAFFDPKFIGNMIQIKNFQLIDSCLHNYCIQKLLELQQIEKLTIIHQSSPKIKDLEEHKIDLQCMRYILKDQEILGFKQLKSLTIQLNDLERFKQLQKLLIENYSSNFKIKIIFGFQIFIKQLIDQCFFPNNFEVHIIAPIFSIFETKPQQFSYLQSINQKSFLDLLGEEIKKFKLHEFKLIQYQDLPKQLKQSQLAIRLERITVEDSLKSSINLYVCSYLQLKDKMGIY